VATIYDLSKEQQELKDILFWEPDDEQALKRLNLVQGSIKQKLGFFGRLVMEEKAEIELRKEALKINQERLSIELKRAEKALERTQSFILTILEMNEIDKITADGFMFSHYLSAGSVKYSDSFDVKRLDLELCEQIPASLKPKTAEIAKRLKTGEVIEGVWLKKKEILKIS
jgi:hypothetical protein